MSGVNDERSRRKRYAESAAFALSRYAPAPIPSHGAVGSKTSDRNAQQQAAYERRAAIARAALRRAAAKVR